MSRPELRALVRNAILLRIAVAVLLHLAVSEDLFAPDQTTYDRFSTWLAQYWAGETVMYPPKLLDGTPNGYYYVVATLYTLFGSFSLVPKLVNAILGGLTALLVYDLARRLIGDEMAALRAARYTAYFPSLILWSALNIRDCWVIFLIVLICREALVLQERFHPGALLILAGSLLAVTRFRDYIFFAVAGPMVVSFFVRNRRHMGRNVFIGMILSAVVIYGDQMAGSQRRGLRTLDLEELQNARQWNTVGAQSSFENADISTPGKAIVFLPIGLTYFLLAPFPWQVTGVRQVLTMPEMLFFYSLIPAIFRGVRGLLRERLAQSLMVLLICMGLTFGYALGEGNAGTAYRHRAQVICFYLIFAAAGVEAARRRARLAAQPVVTARRTA
jgi:4-amino-4-deoxy-L-arabinose transferase-like glycosyltransferase